MALAIHIGLGITLHIARCMYFELLRGDALCFGSKAKGCWDRTRRVIKALQRPSRQSVAVFQVCYEPRQVLLSKPMGKLLTFLASLFGPFC